MGLLQPDSGLLFWMTLAFLAVFLLLAKFGFPIIIRSVEERKAYIDTSLRQAAEAEERMVHLEEEQQELKIAAERERSEIVREAMARREEIIAQARSEAMAEGDRIRTQAIREGEREREAILKDARNQVALLAVAITERMLGEELKEEESRNRLAGQLIDEVASQLKQEA